MNRKKIVKVVVLIVIIVGVILYKNRTVKFYEICDNPESSNVIELKNNKMILKNSKDSYDVRRKNKYEYVYTLSNNNDINCNNRDIKQQYKLLPGVDKSMENTNSIFWRLKYNGYQCLFFDYETIPSYCSSKRGARKINEAYKEKGNNYVKKNKRGPLYNENNMEKAVKTYIRNYYENQKSLVDDMNGRRYVSSNLYLSKKVIISFENGNAKLTISDYYKYNPEKNTEIIIDGKYKYKKPKDIFVGNEMYCDDFIVFKPERIIVNGEEKSIENVKVDMKYFFDIGKPHTNNEILVTVDFPDDFEGGKFNDLYYPDHLYKE